MCLGSHAVFAQLPAKPETGFIYKYEVLGGIKLHSAGMGIMVDYGKHKTYLKRTIFGCVINNQRHPKEAKVENPNYQDAKSYYYGKLNSVFSVRPYYGQRKIVFEKLREKGVEISYTWKIGPALTFLKPVYLDIGYYGSNPLGFEYVSAERYNPEEHFLDNIYGRAPWSKGLSESKIRPGLSLRLSGNFDIAPRGEYMTMIETGLMLDAYHKPLDIMADTKNHQVFLNLFITISLGQRHF